MEIAFGEFKHAAIAIALTPDLQQSRREPAGFRDIVAIRHQMLAAGLQVSLRFCCIVHAILRGMHFPQNQAFRAVGLNHIQVHQFVAGRVRISAQHFLQGHDLAVSPPQHVLAAWADGRHLSQIFGHAGVDVEVQEQGLAAARERVLRTVENQFLRNLEHLLVGQTDQVRRIEDVDIGNPQRAGVVRLH